VPGGKRHDARGKRKEKIGNGVSSVQEKNTNTARPGGWQKAKEYCYQTLSLFPCYCQYFRI